MGSRSVGFLLGVALILLSTTGAQADAIADFYRGKTIVLNVGTSPGSGADIAAAWSHAISRGTSRGIPM